MPDGVEAMADVLRYIMDGNTRATYAHLNKVFVKEEDTVCDGQAYWDGGEYWV